MNEILLALREAHWQMKRMNRLLKHHKINGFLMDDDGPFKRIEELLNRHKDIL